MIVGSVSLYQLPDTSTRAIEQQFFIVPLHSLCSKNPCSVTFQTAWLVVRASDDNASGCGFESIDSKLNQIETTAMNF